MSLNKEKQSTTRGYLNFLKLLSVAKAGTDQKKRGERGSRKWPGLGKRWGRNQKMQFLKPLFYRGFAGN